MPLSQSKTLEEALQLTRATNFDFALLLRILREIDVRLKPLQDQKADVDAAIEAIEQVGLDRINEVLTPAIQAVLTIQERGFLIADSNTSNTLGVGDVLTFTIPDEAERDVFTPSKFVFLSRIDNTDDWGIARLYSYDKITGTLIATVTAYQGDEGPHDDWQISAVAGSTIAQMALLELAEAAFADTDSARDQAVTKAGEAAASAASALASKNAALGAAESAEEDAGIATAQAGIATTKAAEAAASAASIAGGPVASVNGRTGIVTGLAEQSDVDTAIGAVTDLAESAFENTITVTAHGALHAAKAALLRSDGNWEEIAGTVVDLAVGSDYDGAIAAATSIIIADAKYNATSGKVAILFSDNSNLYAVVASVSGNTLTFGSPVAFITGVDNVSSAYAHLVWNAAGTSLIVLGRKSSDNINSLRTATVSGTTINSPTAGTNVGTSGIAAAGMLHDDTHGLRVVMVFTSGAVYYATYVAGTSQTVGTVAATGMAPHVIGKFSNDGTFSFHYDEANYKLVIISTNTIRIVTGAATGTSWTIGDTAVNHGVSAAVALFKVATDKYVIVGSQTAVVASVTLTGASATFSLGTAGRFSPTGQTANTASVAMDPVSKEIAVAYMVTLQSTNEDYRMMGTILAVSGTDIAAISDPVYLKTGYVVSAALLFAHPSGGEFGLIYRDTFNYARLAIASLKKVAGAAKWGNPVQMRSDPPLNLTGMWAPLGSAWKLLAVGIWGASNTVAPLNSCVVTLPSETTNADEWAGVPVADIVDDATGLMKLKGAVVDGFAGLTIGSTYYLKGDNTLSLVNNGREFGRALSATKIKLKAAA